jgi:hypothetical protein
LIEAAEIDGRHHAFVMALAGRHVAYAETVRLCARWVRAKGILSDVLRHEVIELIVGALFEHEPPATAFCGFARFLTALSQKETTFAAGTTIPRGAPPFPLSVYSVATPQSEFTAEIPESAVRLLQAAAGASMRKLGENAFADPQRLGRLVFATPTSHWQVLIHLSPENRVRPECAIGAVGRAPNRYCVKRNILHPPMLRDMMPGFDPVLAFVSRIEQRYDFIHCWLDEFGGPTLGLSFLPDTFDPRSVTEENLKFGRLEGGGVVRDLQLIRAELQALGGELVESVELRCI